MRRVRRHPPSRPRLRGWWMAVLAVASLLFAPVLVSPAHAHGSAPAVGCGMDMPVHAPPKAPAHRHDACCAAACAVCAQLAPARVGEAPSRAPRASAGVVYPRLELRLAGVEPERGTPPPR